MMDVLNVIVPFFDYIGSETNRRNLDVQISNLSRLENVRVILVEGVYDKALKSYSDVVYNHVRVNVESTIWIKENLINIGISHLPNDWEKAAWIDKDITFLNPNWVNEALTELNSCDILQPWTECVFLNSNCEIADVDNVFFKDAVGERNKVVSFCYKQKGTKNVWSHAGHAWCINRKFYDKIGVLFDRAIIGGGDGLMLACILQQYGNKHYQIYQPLFQEHCMKFRGVELGFVDGLITHYHHGDLIHRKYIDRLNVLNRHEYNPLSDVYYNKDGVLTLHKQELESSIKQYFESRNE